MIKHYESISDVYRYLVYLFCVTHRAAKIRPNIGTYELHARLIVIAVECVIRWYCYGKAKRVEIIRVQKSS